MANFTPEFLQDFPRHARAQDKEVLCQSLLVDSEAGTARLVLHRHHEIQGGLNIRHAILSGKSRWGYPAVKNPANRQKKALDKCRHMCYY